MQYGRMEAMVRPKNAAKPESTLRHQHRTELFPPYSMAYLNRVFFASLVFPSIPKLFSPAHLQHLFLTSLLFPSIPKLRLLRIKNPKMASSHALSGDSSLSHTPEDKLLEDNALTRLKAILDNDAVI